MGKFAYGIAASDAEIGHRDAHHRNQQQNVYDLLNGLGSMAQAFGAMKRRQEMNASAAQGAELQGQMMASPDGQQGFAPARSANPNSGSEDAGTFGAGAPTTQPWGQVVSERVKSGQLDPRHASGLFSFIQQQQGMAQDRAYKEASLGHMQTQDDIGWASAKDEAKNRAAMRKMDERKQNAAESDATWKRGESIADRLGSTLKGIGDFAVDSTNAGANMVRAQSSKVTADSKSAERQGRLEAKTWMTPDQMAKAAAKADALAADAMDGWQRINARLTTFDMDKPVQRAPTELEAKALKEYSDEYQRQKQIGDDYRGNIQGGGQSGQSGGASNPEAAFRSAPSRATAAALMQADNESGGSSQFVSDLIDALGGEEAAASATDKDYAMALRKIAGAGNK